MPDGKLTGSGKISVSNQYQGRLGWRKAKGRVELKVVRDSGDYRIASMIYTME
jgi:hypothetical protein